MVEMGELILQRVHLLDALYLRHPLDGWMEDIEQILHVGHDALAAISPDGTFITRANPDSAPFVAQADDSASAAAFWISGTIAV